jgi:hypothetical protein
MLADLVLAAHFAFILFAIFGGWLTLKWPRLIWFHVAAVGWAALVELFGWICPLTPLENRLRRGNGYQSDFVSHYILPLMYPAGLTRNVQITLGIFVIVLNAGIYTWIFLRRERKPGR